MGELNTILSIVEKIGFPLWAAVVLWGVVKVVGIVTAMMNDLRNRDAKMQIALAEHIADADKRLSLMEQKLNFDNHESGRTRV